jgi:hypothetical protein
MLGAYLDPNVAPWRKQTRLVLVGQPAVAPDEGARKGSLWLAHLSDVVHVTDRQGRGTINAQALHKLREDGCAEPLASFLDRAAVSSIGGRRPDDLPLRFGRPGGDLRWFGERFGINRPTPLGLLLGHAGSI